MHVGGTEGKAVMKQGGVNHGSILSTLQQVAQVAQVAMAASNAIASAVLIQDEHLTGTEPALKETQNSCGSVLGVPHKHGHQEAQVNVQNFLEFHKKKLGGIQKYLCKNFIRFLSTYK